jgi:hypothetical protein
MSIYSNLDQNSRDRLAIVLCLGNGVFAFFSGIWLIFIGNLYHQSCVSLLAVIMLVFSVIALLIGLTGLHDS